MNVKVDKTLVASVALHMLVFGWALVSFSSKALEMPMEDSVPVDVVSADQLAKAMAGMKTGKKENPKPLVEKVAESKPPVEDTVGKITEKAPVVTETAPPPQPKPEEKPVEKKPEPKVDPIAAEMKKEAEAKAKAEAEAKAKAEADKPKDEPKKEEPKAEEAPK